MTTATLVHPARHRNALATLLETDAVISPTVLRVTLGLVMLPHGAQKVLGWFGGGGFASTLDFFTDVARIPAALGVLVMAAETIGALALVLGAFTRVAAVGIAGVMIGAIITIHWPHGFFMNWFGNQSGEGFEYHLLAVAMAVALVVEGGGWASLDRLLTPSLGDR